MVAKGFISLSLLPSPQSLASNNSAPAAVYFSSSSNRSKHSSISIDRCSASSSAADVTAKPQIELEFIGPKTSEDGNDPIESTTVISGEKVLRNVMVENKIELYGPYGKVMNCGGGGSCGTCIVEIIDGNDLLSERTRAEDRYLKKKPESWRLACQIIVGNKENSGKVVVQRLPQWKKTT